MYYVISRKFSRKDLFIKQFYSRNYVYPVTNNNVFQKKERNSMKKLFIILMMMTAILLSGCGKEEEVATLEESLASVPKEMFMEDTSTLPIAPDFSQDTANAIAGYLQGKELVATTTPTIWFNDTNYLSINENGLTYLVNGASKTPAMVDVRLFRDTSGQLVFIGMKAISQCRMPIEVAVDTAGTIISTKEFDSVNVDKPSLAEDEAILLEAQYTTLIQKGNNLCFYRFGEAISGDYQMPEKVDGSYASEFVGKDNILYLTLISSDPAAPWISIAAVDTDVKAITDKVFQMEDQTYAFPIYEKTDGTLKSAIMDEETYKAYVYCMYPNNSNIGITPDSRFEIIDPDTYYTADSNIPDEEWPEDENWPDETM